MAILNLIWQTTNSAETYCEYEYITKYLFENFETNHIFDNGSFSTIIDKSLIIYSNNSRNASPKFIDYLNKFRKKNLQFYLLHISNENLRHNCWYYSKANFVFRNYYDPLISNNNVLFMPLGFNSGFMRINQDLNSWEDRTISAVFIGQPKSDRFELIKELEKVESHYIYKTDAFNSSKALSREQCIEIYQKTKYVPCPMGFVHIDSFRVCEALEWGCIPIVKNVNGDDYFKNIFGDHPFKMINNWEEMADVINGENYCQTNDQVQIWYSDFKEKLRLKIFDTIESGGVPADNNRHVMQYLNCIIDYVIWKINTSIHSNNIVMQLKVFAKNILGRK